MDSLYIDSQPCQSPKGLKRGLVRLIEILLGFTAGGFVCLPIAQFDPELKRRKSQGSMRSGPPFSNQDRISGGKFCVM